MVSILIPSFNHARYLPGCLDSILAQTFTDWEVILRDDGSTDDSVEIARGYAWRDPRFHVEVNEANLGTYGTEQAALEQARGEFVAIMNSDDLWNPAKLKRQMELLEKHPECPFCYTRGTLLDASGQPFRTQTHHAHWPTDEVHELLPYLLTENRVLASSALFRREGLRFETSLRYSGDWIAVLELSQRGPAAFVDEPLSSWRIHDQNAHHRSPGQVLEEIRVRQAIDENRARWRNPKWDPGLVERGLAENLFHLQILAILCRDRSLAQRSIWGAGAFPNRKVLWKRRVAGMLPIGFLATRFARGTELNLGEKDVRAIPPLEIR